MSDVSVTLHSLNRYIVSHTCRGSCAGWDVTGAALILRQAILLVDARPISIVGTCITCAACLASRSAMVAYIDAVEVWIESHLNASATLALFDRFTTLAVSGEQNPRRLHCSTKDNSTQSKTTQHSHAFPSFSCSPNAPNYVRTVRTYLLLIASDYLCSLPRRRFRKKNKNATMISMMTTFASTSVIFICEPALDACSVMVLPAVS